MNKNGEISEAEKKRLFNTWQKQFNRWYGAVFGENALFELEKALTKAAGKEPTDD